VPRSRLHLIRFHGVLAPKAKLRAQVVPQGPEATAQEAKPAECEANCAHHRPLRLSCAKLPQRVFEIDMEHRSNSGGKAFMCPQNNRRIRQARSDLCAMPAGRIRAPQSAPESGHSKLPPRRAWRSACLTMLA
jgi:hypothetical protein